MSEEAEKNENEYVIVSKNEKRNMMMVIINGKTCHVPIRTDKQANPQTDNTKKFKGGKNPNNKKKKSKAVAEDDAAPVVEKIQKPKDAAPTEAKKI